MEKQTDKELKRQQLARDVMNMRFSIIKKLHIHDMIDLLDDIWRWVTHEQKDWIFRGNIVHDIVLDENASISAKEVLPKAQDIYKTLMRPTDGLKVVSKKK